MASRYADRPQVTLRYIHRIEGDGYGWRVHITRRQLQHWRYFPDGPDGPAESLVRAIGWRDAMWRQVGPARHERPTVTERCTTGTVGVSLEHYRTTSGNIAHRYRAMWTDGAGELRRRSFSIDKYGDGPARAMAIKARAQGVADAARVRRVQLLDLLQTPGAARQLAGEAGRREP